MISVNYCLTQNSPKTNNLNPHAKKVPIDVKPRRYLSQDHWIRRFPKCHQWNILTPCESTVVSSVGRSRNRSRDQLIPGVQSLTMTTWGFDQLGLYSLSYVKSALFIEGPLFGIAVISHTLQIKIIRFLVSQRLTFRTPLNVHFI